MDGGIAHAINDIGLIALPGRRQLTIAVFVTDSTADEPLEKKPPMMRRREIDNSSHKICNQDSDFPPDNFHATLFGR